MTYLDRGNVTLVVARPAGEVLAFCCGTNQMLQKTQGFCKVPIKMLENTKTQKKRTLLIKKARLTSEYPQNNRNIIRKIKKITKDMLEKAGKAKSEDHLAARKETWKVSLVTICKTNSTDEIELCWKETGKEKEEEEELLRWKKETNQKKRISLL